MSEIYVFYLVSSGTHTSLGTCRNYSTIYTYLKSFPLQKSRARRQCGRNTARHIQKRNKDSNEQLSFAALLRFLPITIIKNWKLKIFNFNSAAKITTLQLQHGFTKIKPKQSKQKPSKLILKRNSFSRTGLELLNYSWPTAITSSGSPNSGWLENLICIRINTKNGFSLVSSMCTPLLSNFAQPACSKD